MKADTNLVEIFKQKILFECSPLWLAYKSKITSSDNSDEFLQAFGEYNNCLKMTFNTDGMSVIFENLEEFIDEDLVRKKVILFGISWNDTINACALKIDNNSNGIIINNFILFVIPLLYRAIAEIDEQDVKDEVIKFLCSLDAEKIKKLSTKEKSILLKLIKNQLHGLETFMLVSILEFLALHELGHIVLKHFDSEPSKKFKLNSFDGDFEYIGFNYAQRQEMDADKFACDTLKKINEYRIKNLGWEKKKVVATHIAVSLLFGYFLYREQPEKSISHPEPIMRINQFLKIWEDFGNNLSLDILNYFIYLKKQSIT